ncbi:MAG: NAD(P)/FAD-dependent oxidoreductase [Xanthomonadales bacterium]|nr:NAD(P)/FAD-dependent oxidoreductase [Gammaproteobacteria bacterium]MBT8053904.1 NAD(P)/FAD-dependent oxidoreductase [Gammaproteobacteria bacterium]NND55983.1 NAD(P)/FAD-dependent oxidoreductase [Xanthomonadales bacterium]NNK52044.1 NAD(P)/FAD-dependent oxidoreductase [Xanthomonadales bacterium]
MIIKTDVVIIGAGPCGLFQVFELGLLDIHSHVVDSLPQVGGQCTELYPDKPIYDIPALPVCGAQELADRLVEQIKPFNAEFHLGQTVTRLVRRDDGRFDLETSAGTQFDAATVILAAGLGAFQPRRLRAKGAEEWEKERIHYRIREPEKLAGKNIVILGGGDSALDWTLELHGKAKKITLVHRRDEYRAQPASVNRMKALVDGQSLVEFQGHVRAAFGKNGDFGGLAIAAPDGSEHPIEADEVFVFWGLSPNLGPIADWGLDLDKRQVRVDTEKFQTNIPGIFAVGDINTYPGKKKLILSGFHEAALAAFGVQQHVHPEKKVRLQYTTTSPIMHKRLGIEE